MPSKGLIASIIDRHRRDRTRLIDILRDIQAKSGFISPEAVADVAAGLGLSTVEVEGVATFYHFFSSRTAGTYAVYLNDSIVSVMKGRAAVAAAFEKAAGCAFGETTRDGRIGLHRTSCIGMNDQEPSALINGVVFTNLTPAKAKIIVEGMKAGMDVPAMVAVTGDGANASKLVRAMVKNNIRKGGPVIFAPFRVGAAVKKAVRMTPEDVIAEIKKSNLLGRGGAGFPTGLKWEFCRRENGEAHYVVCNSDEGEPGTFKDRVILTECPQLLFEGMAVAGYAVGAKEGVLYLRGEYAYLKPYLEKTLADLRKKNILGKKIAGKAGFSFDITIKLGAGAYVCGEESALLQSAQGERGEPRARPPFPVQSGYLFHPTTVNNVETLCMAARILEKGADWFKALGTPRSAGTKVLSVSGDCKKPGVYEIAFGLTVRKLLEMAGGLDAQAVQVGGPSGNCISRGQFDRAIAFEDLATGGSIIVIGPGRDLFEVVHNFMEFFVEESCGWCVPCRAGNPLLLRKLEKIMSGKGTPSDITEIETWGKTIKAMSRCGLGQTSPNPILTTIENFREMYEAKVDRGNSFLPEFDLAESVKAASAVTGQKYAAHAPEKARE
ncbi:MAG: NAD(P)H-dependent oxidoreductase subunit E [Candidatus Aminicenantes bacterium]|nr:NAD(P)H-dependent oxidoreductase subunit E [Candidatus Aminicenantes bacterium]